MEIPNVRATLRLANICSFDLLTPSFPIKLSGYQPMNPGEQRHSLPYKLDCPDSVQGVGVMFTGIACNSNIQNGNAVPLNDPPFSYPHSGIGG